uniref:Cytochrome c biogenesis protein CcsA n=2 Tax=Ephedra TaxID=3387 RepID=A0A8K1VSZ7_9SPER|nr:cytochrome c biogenesis protein [Ephedra distachya]QXG16594.1 cytochrome c biogenesis protein [Ephedra distachya]UEV86489.1 cytochrome c heme attachment protein [Ephedra przewalskii]
MLFVTLEQIFNQFYFSLILVIAFIFGGIFFYPVKELRISGKRGLIFTFFCLTIVLIIRWFSSRHLPLSNLYESLLFISWNSCLIQIILEVLNPNIRWLGAITTPSAMFTHGFATLVLPKEMQQTETVVPSLQTHWLMMHVIIILLAYIILLCGSLASIALLILSSKEKFSLSLFLCSNISVEKKQKSYFPFLVENFRKLQLIQQLDQLGYYTLFIGFILLTIGILSGAVWANEAWGSYWNWDPKEIWALITWLIFAIYIHIRLNKGWKGKKPALVASIGFLFVWICYFGVNLLGIGFHSYGWFIYNG